MLVFRILQAHQPSACHHFPLDFATYESLRKEFKLPPVERHLNTEEQGASGLFEQDDGSFGKVFLLQTSYGDATSR